MGMQEGCIEMMQFCWRLDNVDYVLQEVRPYELKILRQTHPNLIGIPKYYAMMINGEPEWYPQAMKGWPKVFLFSPL